MAHSYWIILAFLPPVLLFAILTGYDRWIVGIQLPSKKKSFQDHTTIEIFYSIFAAITIIANFLGGMVLLDRFEPVSRHFCYLYFILLSFPLTGAMLANYAEIRYHKDVGFKILLFILFLLPTAVFLAGFAYNGVADESRPQEIQVVVMAKRIQINKGGGTPLVLFFPINTLDKEENGLSYPREKEVSNESYETIKIGDEMTLVMKRGTLGIPWLDKVIP